MSKRLFGSYSHSGIPGFPFRLFFSQGQNSRNIFRNKFSFRNIPNERALKFQFATGGNWKSSKRHASSYSIVFGSLQSLPCIFCRNQTKKHCYISLQVVANKKKHFNAEICLPHSNWFDHLSFLPFKLFISNWSLWRNSTHPDHDESSRVENSKASWRAKYGNWIRSQAGINTNVESPKQAILVQAWDTLQDWTKS